MSDGTQFIIAVPDGSFSSLGGQTLEGFITVPTGSVGGFVGTFDTSNATFEGLTIQDGLINDSLLDGNTTFSGNVDAGPAVIQNANLEDPFIYGDVDMAGQWNAIGTGIVGTGLWDLTGANVLITGGGGGSTNRVFNGFTQVGVGIGDSNLIGSPVSTTQIVNANMTGTTSLETQVWGGPISSTIPISFAGSTLDFTGASVSGLSPQTTFNSITVNGVSSIGASPGDVTTLGGLASTTNLVQSTLQGTTTAAGPVQVNNTLTVTGLSTLGAQVCTGNISTAGSVSFSGSTLDFTGASITGLPTPSFNNATLTGNTSIGVGVGESTTIGALGATTTITGANLIGGTVIQGGLAVDSQLWSGPINTLGTITFAGSSLDFTGATVTGLSVQTSFINATLSGNSSIGVANGDVTLIGAAGASTTITNSSLVGGTTIASQLWTGPISTLGTVSLSGSSLDFTGATITGLPVQTSFVNATLSGNSTIGSANGDVTLIGGAAAATTITNASLVGGTTIAAQLWTGSISTLGTISLSGSNLNFGGSTLNFTGATITGLPTPTSFVNATLSGASTIGTAIGDTTDIGSPASITTIYNSILNGATINNTALSGVVSVGIFPGDTTVIGDAAADTEIVNSDLTGSTNIGVANGDVTLIGGAGATTTITNSSLIGGTTIAAQLWTGSITTLGTVSLSGSNLNFGGSTLNFTGATITGLPVQTSFNSITVTGASQIGVAGGSSTTIGATGNTLNIVDASMEGTTTIGTAPGSNTTIGGAAATTSLVNAVMTNGALVGSSSLEIGTHATNGLILDSSPFPGSNSALWNDGGQLMFGNGNVIAFQGQPLAIQLVTFSGAVAPPPGAEWGKVYVSGAGGGGGGYTTTPGSQGGGGGGAAGAFTEMMVATAASFQFTFGIGGAGGAGGNPGVNGSNGGSTVFTLEGTQALLVAGGEGGTRGGAGAAFGRGGSGSMPGGGGGGSVGGSLGGTTQLTPQFGITFEQGHNGTTPAQGRGAGGNGTFGGGRGGAYSNLDPASGASGGGGGGQWGGDGSYGRNAIPDAAEAGQFGAGGGGGGGFDANVDPISNPGAAGGNGFALIIWYDNFPF